MKKKNKRLLTAIIFAMAQPVYGAQYTYDKLDRLIKVTYTNGTIIEYRYDLAGNLRRIMSAGLPTHTLSISGLVTDSEGQPLSDVLVSIGEHTALSGPDGYYYLTDIVIGDYTMMATKNGYHLVSQAVTIGENQPSIINLSLTQSTVDCVLYAVHDEKIKNSQFFTVNPSQDFFVKLLGPLHLAKDVEALDSSPGNHDEIYAASGKDSLSPGMLYILNAYTGELYPINTTGIGFNEISGLSFRPDGSLWAWAKGDGLILIKLPAGVGTLVYASDRNIEDLTWDHEGTVLYLIEKNKLLAYDTQTGNLTELNCQLPGGEVEALEMLPDGHILFATHNDKSVSIHALEPNSCRIINRSISTKIEPFNLDDIEGIAWPWEACSR